MDFARTRPAHSGLIVRDRTERIFRAFFYAHFSPYRSEGAWYGQDPLSGFTQHDHGTDAARPLLAESERSAGR
jgi:hypothetical protein